MTEEYLQLSGIQHYAFCKRQWALIHVEQIWQDNVLTTDGHIFHDRVDHAPAELRGNILTVRQYRIHSDALRFSGICDVVEFHKKASGVPLPGRDGLWIPYPVEYKVGEPKEDDRDKLQLCAQAICLEEMLCCDRIQEGSLFYGKTRRRQRVTLDDALREKVIQMSVDMWHSFERGYTPKVKYDAARCAACSLKDLCLNNQINKKSPAEYYRRAIQTEV